MIYIVKDCMTQTRQDNIVVGRKNVELNQTGLLEAKKLAKQLKDVKFDVIYCSPLGYIFIPLPFVFLFIYFMNIISFISNKILPKGSTQRELPKL